MENKEQILEEAAELYYLETKHRAPSCKKHFIEGAKWQQEQDKKCYHPMTERKHTSDVHFECTICGYNNY